MFDNMIVKKKSFVDIGANQGYFSIEAALRGAQNIDAFESDQMDGEFIDKVSRFFPELNAIKAFPIAFDFQCADDPQYDCVLCLNVLHHVGRYFDVQVNSLTDAKMIMCRYLRKLLAAGSDVWLQIGFNWQGNESLPMFKNGTKMEMTDFVTSLIGNMGIIKTIGIYNPEGEAFENVSYADSENKLWERIEYLGEFANRPIYLIESNCHSERGHTEI